MIFLWLEWKIVILPMQIPTKIKVLLDLIVLTRYQVHHSLLIMVFITLDIVAQM